MAQFQRGISGNPSGRPAGIQDKRTALRNLLDGRGEELLERAIERALDGDGPMLAALVSKIVPPQRPESFRFSFQDIGGSLSERCERVLSAAMSGEISVNLAHEFLQSLSASTKVLEFDSLLSRIRNLESKLDVLP